MMCESYYGILDRLFNLHPPLHFNMKTTWGLWSLTLLSSLSLLLPPVILWFTCLVLVLSFLTLILFTVSSVTSRLAYPQLSLWFPYSQLYLSFTSNVLKSSTPTVFSVNHHYLEVFHLLILSYFLTITSSPFNFISIIPSTYSSNPLRLLFF